ncbi:phage virion morphogenesis protein [Variovorax sp. UMC13]|uniref:phage virion morphogenesis protein n=1 Tax=Variovorax sp. UMC13 TaxID=1862326 RepID=UPI0016040F73|nr:phage virion morphogenesis protein [Variovorax sp. UMC13]MBB1601574.1 phage virion morphogenesis protein [Variovorax sp. UMC13]
MAGTHLKVEVSKGEVKVLLGHLGQDGTGDLVPRLGEYLLRSTKDRFAAQQAPDGTPWQPLQPRYARRKKYNKDKVLTLRGYLRGGIRYQPEGETAAVVGTNSPYAAMHQFGGVFTRAARQAKVRLRTVSGRILFAGKKHKKAEERNVMIGAHEIKMPARPFLGISDADRKSVIDIVRDWIRERTAR